MKANNYSIHPSVYFIVAALLIAYFFPREGKFRYQFYEGKPWRYGLLTAPSDFPIYKTDAEVQAEGRCHRQPLQLNAMITLEFF